MTTEPRRLLTDVLTKPFKPSSIALCNLMHKTRVRFARVNGHSNLTRRTLIVSDGYVLLVRATCASDAIDAGEVRLSLCK
jgi:hypothetical protein